MSKTESLEARRQEILQELATLREFRRGSVTQQFYDDTRKDGTSVRRGPYPIYTFKDKQTTRSRRLHGQEQTRQYQEQIQAFRRVQELVDELLQIGEQTADLACGEGKDKKKRPRAGRRL